MILIKYNKKTKEIRCKCGGDVWTDGYGHYELPIGLGLGFHPDQKFYIDKVRYTGWIGECEKCHNKIMADESKIKYLKIWRLPMRKRTRFPCWDNGKKSYTRGGRVQCDICKSFKGVYSRNYYRKDKDGNGYFKLFRRCANCGSVEITNNSKGGILEQRINRG